MIDVTIQPFGRTLASMALGVMKYKAVVNQRNTEFLAQQTKQIEEIQKDVDLLEEISFDITTDLIDKRFNTSKEFIRTGGLSRPKSFNYKKSTSENDRNLQRLIDKKLLQTKASLNNATSTYNQKLETMKQKMNYKMIK